MSILNKIAGIFGPKDEQKSDGVSDPVMPGNGEEQQEKESPMITPQEGPVPADAPQKEKEEKPEQTERPKTLNL